MPLRWPLRRARRIQGRITSAVLLMVCAVPALCAAAGPGKPNILFILADDLGLQDLGAFQLPVATDSSASAVAVRPSLTPSIDRLAAEGIRFTRFYTDASCAATRAGILTGRPPAALGFRPAGRGIDPELVTLPEALRAAGYRTQHLGKWHLGYRSQSAWPLQQGYDAFFGFLNQFLLSTPPDARRLGRPTHIDPFLQRGNRTRERYAGHLNDLLMAEATRLLQQLSASRQPWFLSLWSFLPHEPLQPPPSVASGFGDSPRERYRAMLAALDESVGQLLQMLETSGSMRDTVIVFASDNGGTARHVNSNGPLPGSKGWLSEGGQRVPLIVRLPGAARPGERRDLATYLDLMPTLLGVADAAPPPDLVGRDLFAAGARENPQFWASGAGDATSWSMLSADGSWRVSGGAFAPHGALQRLGENGAVAQQPGDDQRVRDATAAYTAWAVEQRRVALRRSFVDDRGHGSLAGASMQRAPGGRAHTISLCLSELDGAGAVHDEWLVSHPRQWSLRRRGRQLHWEFAGLALDLELPSQVRGRLTLVADIESALAFPGLRGARLSAYWNEMPIGTLRAADFSLSDAGIELPTQLGLGPEDARPFTGTIGAVAIWNDLPHGDAFTESADAQVRQRARQRWREWSGGFNCAE